MFFYFLVNLISTSLIWKKKLPLIQEPVGSVSPKLNAGSDQKHLSGFIATDITFLTCSAQAFPVPVTRWVSRFRYLWFRYSSVSKFFLHLNSFWIAFGETLKAFMSIFLFFSLPRTDRFCFSKNKHRGPFVGTCCCWESNIELDLSRSELSVSSVPVRIKIQSYCPKAHKNFFSIFLLLLLAWIGFWLLRNVSNSELFFLRTNWGCKSKSEYARPICPCWS